MNPLIKTLWDKAAAKHSGDSWAEQVAFLEEFAKLIANECVDICERIELPYCQDEAFRSAWKQGCEDSASYIEQHFGIADE